MKNPRYGFSVFVFFFSLCLKYLFQTASLKFVLFLSLSLSCFSPAYTLSLSFFLLVSNRFNDSTPPSNQWWRWRARRLFMFWSKTPKPVTVTCTCRLVLSFSFPFVCFQNYSIVNVRRAWKQQSIWLTVSSILSLPQRVCWWETLQVFSSFSTPLYERTFLFVQQDEYTELKFMLGATFTVMFMWKYQNPTMLFIPFEGEFIATKML